MTLSSDFIAGFCGESTNPAAPWENETPFRCAFLFSYPFHLRAVLRTLLRSYAILNMGVVHANVRGTCGNEMPFNCALFYSNLSTWLSSVSHDTR